MTSKIQRTHLQKPAYIYIRQSSMGQVRHHQESTERQYALRDKALQLGWSQDMIRILDYRSVSNMAFRKQPLRPFCNAI